MNGAVANGRRQRTPIKLSNVFHLDPIRTHIWVRQNMCRRLWHRLLPRVLENPALVFLFPGIFLKSLGINISWEAKQGYAPIVIFSTRLPSCAWAGSLGFFKLSVPFQNASYLLNLLVILPGYLCSWFKLLNHVCCAQRVKFKLTNYVRFSAGSHLSWKMVSTLSQPLRRADSGTLCWMLVADRVLQARC